MPTHTPFHPLLSLFLLAAVSFTPHSTSLRQCTTTTTTVQQVRAGFWLSHSTSYSPVSRINTTLFTHLYFSSLSLDFSTLLVSPPPPDELPVLAGFSNTVKNQNPSLKTLLSVSSTDHQQANFSSAFSSMAGNAANRAAFILSAIEIARKNAFDGLDLAWQFPSSSSDMDNLGLLLTEWRARIDQEATDNGMPPLLLTASVYFSGHLFNAPSDNLDYPIYAISNSLDWVNTLCFGYHSDGESTAADAALYDVTSHLSTSYGITSWLDAGLSPCKLVMGIPLYGRSWFLKNKMKYGLGAEVVAAGPKQKPSNQTGIMAFFEVEEFMRDPDAEFMYDSRSVSAYFHARNIWVSFDSPKVAVEKIAFARKNELLGYFLWPISFDTSNNTISQLASDAWMGDLTSMDMDDGNGTEQSLSPVDFPPQDFALDRSASTADSGQIASPICIYYFMLLILTLLFTIC